MLTKEAIQWIKTEVFCKDTMGNEKKLRDFECNQDSIIELLQQGEVSRQMIEKMRKEKYDVWVSLPGSFISLADFISDIEEEVTGK